MRALFVRITNHSKTRAKTMVSLLGAICILSLLTQCASKDTRPRSYGQPSYYYHQPYQPPYNPYQYYSTAPNSRSYYNPYDFQSPYGNAPYVPSSDHDQYYVQPRGTAQGSGYEYEDDKDVMEKRNHLPDWPE